MAEHDPPAGAGAAQPELSSGPITDIKEYWDRMDPGLKSRAMHEVHENQQKLVIELQRVQMETLDELGLAIVKARAAEELKRPEERDQVIAEEVEPMRAKLRDLQAQIDAANVMLQAYQAIGRGIL
jgi:hypothetical protein